MISGMAASSFLSTLLAVHFLLFTSTASAFVTSSSSLWRHPSAASAAVSSIPTALHALKSTDTSADVDNDANGITRRGMLRSTTAIGAAASLAIVKPTLARAATAAITSSATPSKVVPITLCDPSVSTWVKTYTGDDVSSNTMRTVHLLGTAHISSSSAELAGKLVRDVKPNVVFVELDAKRVARAIPGGINNGGGSGGNSVASSGSTSSNVQSSLPNNDGSSEGRESPSAPTTTAASAFTSTPSNDASNTKSNPFDVQSKLVDAGSKVVGNSVKSMYGKLESEGFKAGDEFAMSVREGLAIGSTIVLGDRDVEVTLRRLTRALAKTDIRKLLSADSEVERSMEQLLPENMKEQLKQPAKNNNGGGGDGSMSVAGMGTDDVAYIDKQEFTTFVETMKAKENVKKIMGALKKTAPEIYEAMVAERDEYMGQGLDELGSTLASKGSRVDDTVAVVGMAHVDGIERYLASRGWEEMIYPCPGI